MLFPVTSRSVTTAIGSSFGGEGEAFSCFLLQQVVCVKHEQQSISCQDCCVLLHGLLWQAYSQRCNFSFILVFVSCIFYLLLQIISHHKLLHDSCEGKEFSPFTGTTTDGNRERSCELKFWIVTIQIIWNSSHESQNDIRKKSLSSVMCWFLFISDLFFGLLFLVHQSLHLVSGHWITESLSTCNLPSGRRLPPWFFFCYRTKSNWCANLNHRYTGSGRTWIVL